jgi:tetraacyldisaccharide 4'-kinase
MDRIKKKIETIMANGNEGACFGFESFLFGISVAYGGCVKLRQNLYRAGWLQPQKLPCVVISIGNLAVGGTGKTPMTFSIAQRIRRLGYRVVVLSRGYKGTAEKRAEVVSDGCKIYLEPGAAGDEPFMLATQLEDIPVLVGRNRFETGMLAVRDFNPQVLVLDDAFQHLQLARDLDLVLLDYAKPFGNKHLLPRGILREPLSALLRADAFILTRADTAFDSNTAASLAEIKRYTHGKPIFKTVHVSKLKTPVQGSQAAAGKFLKPLSADKFFRGQRVFAFSGLAKNRDFQRTVAGLNCILAGFLEFSDHHPYSQKDFENIITSARAAKADCLITSEKDYMRTAFGSVWPMDLVVVGIESAFGADENNFSRFLEQRLEQLVK